MVFKIEKLLSIAAALAFVGFGGACASKKSVAGKSRKVPKQVVVLPVANQTQDRGAPVLVRYALVKKLKKRGLSFPLGIEGVDRKLREMGIMSGNHVRSFNLQQIGQFLKAEAVVQCTLLEFRQDLRNDKTVIRARFQLVETETGFKLWETETRTEKNGARKVPIRGAVAGEWSSSQLRAALKSPAGKLAKDLAAEAVKSLPKKVPAFLSE